MDAFHELLDHDMIFAESPRGGRSRDRSLAGRRSCHASGSSNARPGTPDTLVPTSEFIDAGERVVVRFIWRGIGHGPESNLELTAVYTVRERRLFYQE